MGRQIHIAQSEPCFAAQSLERVHGHKAIAPRPPTTLFVDQSGQRVEHGVDVRGDAQAMQGHVVAGVHDDGELGIGRGRPEPASEARAANSAGERHDPLHQGIQPTKRMLRRLKANNGVTDSLWIVVVARVGSAAKSRMATALSAEQRSLLALAMLADVVAVCDQARGLAAGTLAVVDKPAARAVALRGGALSIADPGTGDMNAAVSAGLAAARPRGADTVLVVPGD